MKTPAADRPLRNSSVRDQELSGVARSAKPFDRKGSLRHLKGPETCGELHIPFAKLSLIELYPGFTDGPDTAGCGTAG